MSFIKKSFFIILSFYICLLLGCSSNKRSEVIIHDINGQPLKNVKVTISRPTNNLEKMRNPILTSFYKRKHIGPEYTNEKGKVIFEDEKPNDIYWVTVGGQTPLKIKVRGKYFILEPQFNNPECDSYAYGLKYNNGDISYSYSVDENCSYNPKYQAVGPLEPLELTENDFKGKTK